MIDNFSELIKFSPFGGELVLEEVKGTTSGKLNPENDVDTVIGADRDMYAYIPKTGCPHAKQAQVFMVLRSCSCQKSAEEVMHKYKLDELAEKYHFILLFPNPVGEGWNYTQDEHRDNDVQYLVRCFAALPKSKGGVAGFNGMINYLGVDPESSAMAMTLAAVSPLDAAAVMVGRFPEGYEIPEGKNAQQAAWVYEGNTQAWEYLQKVNTPEKTNAKYVIACCTEDELSAELVDKAWDTMFSETRRWRNDTYGIYQPRIDFAKKGYVSHVQDDCLGVNDGFKHTWYEYVPEKIRNTEEKVPLLFYFHGINCTGLYGAEQSGWSDIAERENFIVVYPNPAIEERWNVWDDARLPSDVSYIMVLIEHMKEVHPIDETRIYISGFSMGSMFTNALACSYPDVFAGAVAMNGPNWGYLQTLDTSKPGMIMFNPRTIIKDLPESDDPESPTKKRSDAKKVQYDYRRPFVQFVGLLDGVGITKALWPVNAETENTWLPTIQNWVRFNGKKDFELTYTEETPSGFASDTCERIGERFIEQTWKNDEGETLYHFVTVERMPHAVDLQNAEIGWQRIKNYRRCADGALGKD
ncbi:MAG: hypothetical protein IJJ29_06250 [Solobacterium sp.]|nr:hypothetical protein [Solobacterium sp.]